MVLPLLLALAVGSPNVDPGTNRPNVLILYTDDQGYGDCGALNAEAKLRTPHMDRLAAEGLVFTDGHSPGSVCTPSRYGLLTGRYAWRVRPGGGVLGADADGMIQDGQTTLATLLGGLGYDTALFGKWHLGMQIPGTKGERDWSLPVLDGPLQKGFDTFYGIPASMNFGVLTWYEQDRATEPASLWTRKKFPPSEIEAKPLDYRMAPPFDEERQAKGDIEVAPSFVDEHVLAKITERTVAYLEQPARRETPFFVYVAFTSPHLPHCTAEAFRGKSPMGNYGDFLLETDHRVGEILAALERQGLAENTLVLLSSDNGPENNYRDWQRLYGHRSAGGFRGGKRDVYEGGHRVPFLVRWPAVIEAGRRSARMVSQTDVLATLAEITGCELTVEERRDSVSFLPALKGLKEAAPRPAMVHHGGKWNAVREGDWKLVLSPEGRERGPELYNLKADPAEAHDLAEQHPERVKALRLLLTDLKRL